MQLDFMNQIPEIVCEILCYLAKFYHYRTNKITPGAYRILMNSTLANKSAADVEQQRQIDEEGWRYSERGRSRKVAVLDKDKLK